MELPNGRVPVATPVFCPEQIDRDLKRKNADKNRKYIEYWQDRPLTRLPVDKIESFDQVFLEVGAGSGDFFLELSRHSADTLFIAVERDRMRGKSLVKRAERENRANFVGQRGNIIPNMTCGVPDESLDRIYLLYPCPWPKNSQRKNRWYFHPMMAHMVRALKPGGLLIWASDQSFYIDEAAFVCREIYDMNVLHHAELAPNPWNDLTLMPEGRTKFERNFLEEGQPCFEVIAEKPKNYQTPLFC